MRGAAGDPEHVTEKVLLDVGGHFIFHSELQHMAVMVSESSVLHVHLLLKDSAHHQCHALLMSSPRWDGKRLNVPSEMICW